MGERDDQSLHKWFCLVFCCFKFCSFSSSPLKMCITMCTLSIHSQSIQVVLCADERCFFFSVSGQEERVTQEHKISVDSWAVVWWRVEKNKGRRKSIFVCFICHCCRNLLFAVKRWCVIQEERRKTHPMAVIIFNRGRYSRTRLKKNKREIGEELPSPSPRTQRIQLKSYVFSFLVLPTWSSLVISFVILLCLLS